MSRAREAPPIVPRHEERGYGAAVHLLSAIPLWGPVFLLALWVYFKERSREIVLHIQQALVFHGLMLGILVVYFGLGLLLKPIGIINEGLADLLAQLNLAVLVLCYGVYVAVCLYGTVLTFLGRPYVCPLVGRQVLEGSLLKSTAED
jgi:hypothetical protein